MNSRILKILSGPNCGAEAELVPGRYVLGSDPECDIVLTDSAVSPHHLALEIDFRDQTISTQAIPLEGQSLLKNERIKESGVPVEDFALLTLGGTCIALGPADQLWPAVILPDLIQSGSTISQPETDTPEPETEKEPESKVEKTGEEKKTASKEIPDRQKLPAWLLFFLAILIVILVGANIWRTLFPSVSDRERMQTLLSRGDFQEIKLKSDDKGNLSLEGYVLKNVDLERLRRIVEQIPAKVNVRVLSNAVTTLRRKLADQKSSLRVRQAGRTVVMSGYLEDQDSREKLPVLLREALPEGVKIKYNLINWQDMTKLLQQSLAARGLEKKLFFTPSDNKILVQGHLSQEELAQWQGITEEILDGIGGDNPFSKVQSTEISTSVSTFQIQKTVEQELKCEDLQLVKTNRQYYITLRNKRYEPGEVLPGGYRIKDVTDKRIVLGGQGQLLYCPILSKKENK